MSHLAEPGGQAPAPEPAPEPAPQPEPQEFYEVKYRGEVQQAPKPYVEGLAQALGTTPDGVINAIQRAREADRIARQNSRLEAELEALRQQQAGQYQERMGGGAPPPPVYQPAPPAYNPYALPQPYQPQAQPGQMDPLVMLQEMYRTQQAQTQELQEFKQMTAWQIQQAQAQQEQNLTNQQAAQIEAQAERYLADKNKGRKEPIELQDFLDEVELSGGLNRHVPLEAAFDRAHTWMTRDEIASTAQADLQARLRAPNARVIVPAAPAVNPQPVQKPEDMLGGLRLSDVIDYIPKR